MRPAGSYIILLMVCFKLNAGNTPALISAKADIKKVNASYASQANFSMDTYYSVFSEQQNNNLLEGKNGKFIRYNKNSYTKIDDIETYAIDDVLICITPENKKITVGDNRELDFHPLQTNIDSLLTLCSDVKMETKSATEKVYKLYFSEAESEFNRVDIYIDTKSYHYLKIVLFYQVEINLTSDFYAEEKKPRLEIAYKNYKPLQTEPPAFKQAIYITNDDGKLKPGPKYYNYKISDLRNKTRIKKPN